MLFKLVESVIAVNFLQNIELQANVIMYMYDI